MQSVKPTDQAARALNEPPKPKEANTSRDNQTKQTTNKQINNETIGKLFPANCPSEAIHNLDKETIAKALQETRIKFTDIFRPKTLFNKLIHKMLYVPAKLSYQDLQPSFDKLIQAGLPIEDNFIKTRDNQFIRMWFAKNPDPEAHTKIYFHGNASDITTFSDQAIQDFNDGYNVCLFSYRGYSGCQGIPTEDGLTKDGLALLEELIDRRGIPAETIDIKAHSLGAAVAISTLVKRMQETNPELYQILGTPKPHIEDRKTIQERFNHIELVAPFSNIKNLAPYYFRLIPTFIKRYLLNDIWNSLEKVKYLLTNTHHINVVHGSKDKVIPVKEGKKLYDEIRNYGIPGNFIEIPEAGHNDIPKYKQNITEKTLQIPLPYADKLTHLSTPKVHNKANGYEYAVDIFMPIGTPIYAVKDGVVVMINESNEDHLPNEKCVDKNFANNVNEIVIADTDGLMQQYAHAKKDGSKGLIKVGDQVKAGQHISYSGHNGLSTEPHLHFAVGVSDTNISDTNYRSIPIKFVSRSSKLAGQFTNAA